MGIKNPGADKRRAGVVFAIAAASIFIGPLVFVALDRTTGWVDFCSFENPQLLFMLCAVPPGIAGLGVHFATARQRRMADRQGKRKNPLPDLVREWFVMLVTAGVALAIWVFYLPLIVLNLCD